MGKIIEFNPRIRFSKKNEDVVPAEEKDIPVIIHNSDDKYFLNLTFYGNELEVLKKCVVKQRQKNQETNNLRENSVLDDVFAFIIDNECKAQDGYDYLAHILELDFIIKAVSQYPDNDTIAPAEKRMIFNLQNRLDVYKKQYSAMLTHEYKINLENLPDDEKLEIIKRDWHEYLKDD